MQNKIRLYFSRSERYLPYAALLGALVVIPALNLCTVGAGEEKHALISIETVAQLGRFLSFAVVALGIDLIWGYTGILTMCQAMFFCFGGYAMGMYLALHGPLDGDGIPRCLFVVSSDVSGFHLPWFWKPFNSLSLALVLGLLVPGVTAFIFGYFAFRSRVRGVYFSIITQATTLAVWYIFCRNSMRLCGTNGLTNFVKIAGWELREPSTKLGLYVVTVIVLAAVYVGCRWIVNSRLGRILIAIRDNESRLRFSGYRPLYFKLFVFTLSAVIAGIGGMLYVPQMGIITPANMGNLGVSESIVMVIWVAVGGRATLSGAIIGAVGVNYIYNILTSGTIYKWLAATSLFKWLANSAAHAWLYPSSPGKSVGAADFLRWPLQKVVELPELVLGAAGWPLVLGGLFIGVVLFFPDGVVGAWRRLMSPRKPLIAATPLSPSSGSDEQISAPTLEARI